MKAIKLLFASLVLVTGASMAQDAKVLRFGVEAAYPPFEYKDADGTVKGFDIDLGNALCAEMKVKCEWVETPFDSLIPSLQAKKFDAINSALSITEKRKTTVDFTDAMYQVPTKLIAKTGSNLSDDPKTLVGKRVGVLRGSIQEDYANKKWKALGVTVNAYDDQNLIYLDLLAKRVDATLVEAVAGSEGFLSKPEGKGYAFVGKTFEDPLLGFGIGIALRKEDKKLTQQLNDAFKKLKASGGFQSIAKKYFDFDVSIK